MELIITSDTTTTVKNIEFNIILTYINDDLNCKKFQIETFVVISDIDFIKKGDYYIINGQQYKKLVERIADMYGYNVWIHNANTTKMFKLDGCLFRCANSIEITLNEDNFNIWQTRQRNKTIDKILI
tara:strand:- start:55175 stop:55555 length:381 start_codon:yes stop_codon:yes gene_type:complete